MRHQTLVQINAAQADREQHHTMTMFGRARSSRTDWMRWHSALCAGQAATAHALPQYRALRQPVQ